MKLSQSNLLILLFSLKYMTEKTINRAKNLINSIMEITENET